MLDRLINKVFSPLGLLDYYESLKHKTILNTYYTIDTLFKIILSALFFLLLVWISILIYVIFYFSYVPNITHTKTANFHFEPCDPSLQSAKRAMCGFPKAQVQLTKYGSLLMVGQSYKISLVLELPESDTNKQLGMFMVCGQLVGAQGKLIGNSCRSSMLHFTSPLLRNLRLFAFGPFYILGVLQEKQTLSIDLFSNFEDDQNLPVTDIYVELQSDIVEVYSSEIQIEANLHGLRHLMYHWPFFSTIFGTLFNLSVIVFILLLSWYKLYTPSGETGKEFVCKQFKQIDSQGWSTLTTDMPILDEDDDHEENVEEIEGKKCLILESEDFEEDETDVGNVSIAKKFPLRRKMSSSDA